MICSGLSIGLVWYVYPLSDRECSSLSHGGLSVLAWVFSCGYPTPALSSLSGRYPKLRGSGRARSSPRFFSMGRALLGSLFVIRPVTGTMSLTSSLLPLTSSGRVMVYRIALKNPESDNMQLPKIVAAAGTACPLKSSHRTKPMGNIQNMYTAG